MPRELTIQEAPALAELDDAALAETIAAVRKLKQDAAAFAQESLADIGKPKTAH